MGVESYSHQQGFNLVELMVVLGVIGVLTSIALPMYSNYVARANHAAGLRDLAPGKMQIEINLNENSGQFRDAADIGLPSTTPNCSAIEISASVDTGEATLSCTIKGNSAIDGSVITLKRTPTGEWSCESTARSEFVGSSCSSVGG
jgi:type IV pilus assembly protein PilA